MSKWLSRLVLGLVALGAMTLTASAQTDIAGVTTAVSGYVTAAIVVGVAVLLFVLGRRVVRKLIAVALTIGTGFMVTANAQPTDIAGVTTAVSGYVTAAIVVGVAVLLFVLGRRVVRKLI